MKALVVPGITDLNKGDQALVWESVRLIYDTGLYKDVFVLSNGDTKEEHEALCSQTVHFKGFKLVKRILKHPRRGYHPKDSITKESFGYLVFQIKNAVFDFLFGAFLLLICKNSLICRIFLHRSINQSLDSIREVDTVFVKGGGFIHAHGEKTAPYLMWYLLFYLRLAHRLNKKVIVLPNSYGPFRGVLVGQQVKSVVGRAAKVYAREGLSADAIGGILKRSIPVYPDLGFYLEAAPSERVSNLFKRYFLKHQPIVGLTLRPWRFPGSADGVRLYEKYIASIADLVDHIAGRGFKVAIFNQSMGPNKHEDDREAIRYFLDTIPEGLRKKVIWVDENLTCGELKWIYSKLYALVGTRFHSFIFSISAHVPSMAIAYGGNKASGIMREIGLDDYIIGIEDVTGQDLIAMFSRLEEHYDEIRSMLPLKIKKILSNRDVLVADLRRTILEGSGG